MLGLLEHILGNIKKKVYGMDRAFIHEVIEIYIFNIHQFAFDIFHKSTVKGSIHTYIRTSSWNKTVLG